MPDDVVQRCAQELDKISLDFLERSRNPEIAAVQRAIDLAKTIKAMKDLLTEQIMQTLFIPLMNSQLGFKTDRGPRAKREDMRLPYSWQVVRDCLIDALLSGFRPVGNEFNIISEGMMGVLNGWKRLCEEIPGITDLTVSAGPPWIQVKDGDPVIRVIASWKKDGISGQLTGATDGKGGCIYQIEAKGGFGGVDALRGKALRRAYKDIYHNVTGTRKTEPELDEDSALPAQPVEPPLGRHDLRGGNNGNKATVEPPVSDKILPETRKELGYQLRRLEFSQDDINLALQHFKVKCLDDLSQEQATAWIGSLAQQGPQPGMNEGSGLQFEDDPGDEWRNYADQGIAEIKQAESQGHVKEIVRQLDAGREQGMDADNWRRIEDAASGRSAELARKHKAP